MWRFLEYHSLPSDASSDNYLKALLIFNLIILKAAHKSYFDIYHESQCLSFHKRLQRILEY